MIHVIAEVTVVSGKRDEFLAAFHEVVPKVHAEVGCIEYGPTVDIESGIAVQEEARPNVVTIMEKWESLDTLEDHLNAPHMAEYRQQVKDLVVDLKLTITEPA